MVLGSLSCGAGLADSFAGLFRYTDEDGDEMDVTGDEALATAVKRFKPGVSRCLKLEVCVPSSTAHSKEVGTQTEEAEHLTVD